MEDVLKENSDTKAVRLEFLECLKRFEEEDWVILGWNHMHLGQTRGVDKPQKLKECDYYRVIKSWLEEDGTQVLAKDYTPDGLVRYEYNGVDISFSLAVKSIFFLFILGKGEIVCFTSYGEHSFPNKFFQETLGGARYSLAFKNWKEVLPRFLTRGNCCKSDPN